MDGYLICYSCSTKYDLNDKRWRCDCGGILDIEFKSSLDISRINGRKSDIWRYREALPIDNDIEIISFGEGYTPLLPIPFNGREILFKQDHLFPTGSYKDRGAAVMINKLKQLGIKHVVEDSSGNAGASIAAYCARAGIACDIFVPDSTPAGKLKQIAAYGAKIHEIPGGRKAAAKAALENASEYYYASHCWNPFFIQGTKTFAYEICEQLGWKAPDTVIVPVGNGTILLGAYMGFKDLLYDGIIERLPRLIAIQAASCAPLYEAFANSSEIAPDYKGRPTIAEGIAIASPIRGAQIIEAVKNTDGNFIAVGDDDILAALKLIHAQGYYIEPTSAATVAGVMKYITSGYSNELIVSTFTGHGLKKSDDK